ncbi:uncharacterized protein LOC142583457 [Dermacentor variabilis]|uniref:uncharacterized protein LOC142583457 n=1 Tax=Dermacentor variabilis TaxID=34621 RepID=UPI003F5AE614
MRLALATACLLIRLFAPFTRAENASPGASRPAPAATTLSAEEQELAHYGQALRDVVARVMASIPDSLRTQLLGADVRPECSVGLLRTVRALQNLEPWVLRLLDATGKYPTGLLQWSRADIGAFDECIATVVRDSYGHEVSHGQYCNLLVYAKNSTNWGRTIEKILSIMHPKASYYKGYFSYNKVAALRLGICYLDDCNQQDMQALVDTATF